GSPNPWPPSASATCRPSQPCSTSDAQKPGSSPRSVSRRARGTDGGQWVSVQRRTAACSAACSSHTPSGMTAPPDSSGARLAVPGYGDGLGRAPLGGQDDPLLGLALGVYHDGQALVVEVERRRGPVRAVAGAHAGLAVDRDLQAHHPKE